MESADRRGRFRPNVSAVTLSERMMGAALLALVLIIMGGILLQNVRRSGRTR